MLNSRENSRITPADRQIAKRIRELRESTGTFVTVMASHLGMTYQSYQKVEGGRTAIRATWLITLSQIFDVPVSRFYDDVAVDHGDEKNVDCVLAFAKAARGVPPEITRQVTQTAIATLNGQW